MGNTTKYVSKYCSNCYTKNECKIAGCCLSDFENKDYCEEQIDDDLYSILNPNGITPARFVE